MHGPCNMIGPLFVLGLSCARWPCGCYGSRSLCDGPDPYETALSEAGIDFASIPVLQSASCGLDRLAFLISRSDSYDALVFTSHRAVFVSFGSERCFRFAFSISSAIFTEGSIAASLDMSQWKIGLRGGPGDRESTTGVVANNANSRRKLWKCRIAFRFYSL